MTYKTGDRVRVLCARQYGGALARVVGLVGTVGGVYGDHAVGVVFDEDDNPYPAQGFLGRASLDGEGWGFTPDQVEPAITKTARNKPFNIAQNAAKRATADVLGIKQKHVHAGMEAYRAAYAAVRDVQGRVT